MTGAERILLALVAVLLAVGAWETSRGVWIHARALTARLLIGLAWERSLTEAPAHILDRRSVSVTGQAGPSRLTLVTFSPFGALRAGGRERYVLLAFLS